MKYRKKPVVIEAETFDPATKPWPRGVLPYDNGFSFDPLTLHDCGEQKSRHGALWVGVLVCPGYIVTTETDVVTGTDTRHVFAPDIFAATYEPA